MAKRGAIAFLLFAVLAAYPALMRSRRAPAAPAKKPSPAAAKPAARPKAPVSSEKALIQSWMRGMKLEDKVAQLVMITSYGESMSSRSTAFRDLRRSIRDLGVGGIIVVNRVVGGSVRQTEPHSMAAFLNRMQRFARVPLIVGADFERGASMRVSGTVKYPHQMAYGAANDVALTRAFGQATAREARALGVHWVFAPVADVNSNPENPIINIRSFGENPKAVADHVAAFVQGAHSDPTRPVLVTAKHFPGHGDTSVDSHMGLPKLEADRPRLDATELVPFRSAIKAGVDAVMTAHMAVPAVEAKEIPATISASVLSGLLRQELAFNGLIVTDAMDMQGLTKHASGGEIAVRAIEAGVDMLLMPTNPEVAIQAVTAAVRSGRLSQRRIDDSLQRVLAAKAKLRLDRHRYIDVEEVNDVLDSPDLAEHAQTAADRALTLVRNQGDVLPLRQPDKACLVALTESRFGQQGRRLAEELKQRGNKIRLLSLDPLVPPLEMEQNIRDLDNCQTVVIAAFVSVGAYRGNVALGGSYPQLVETLLSKRDRPAVLISLGSPYLLKTFPQVQTYLATFSPAPTAEAAVVKALFGEIRVGGTMPVTIPGITALGDGLKSLD